MRQAFLVVGVLIGLAGCGGDEDAAETTGTSETVTITETDFALDPESVTLEEPGTYAFEVVNDGQVAHALEIEGEGIEEKTRTLGPGERATLTVDLDGGTYELYCPVGNHAAQGMKGELEVGDAESDSGRGGY